MTSPASLSIRSTPFEHPDAVELRAAQRRELDVRYGGDTEPGIKPTAADMSEFVIAYDETSGEALGCGGLRMLDDGTAELKRMFVVQHARGSGVSTAILRELEARAMKQGCTTLRLETGTAQPDAVRFYEREGYVRTANFGAYAGIERSLCYARQLA